MPGKLIPTWLSDAIDKRDKIWREYNAITNIILDGCVSMHLQSMVEHPAYADREKLGDAWCDAANQANKMQTAWDAMTPEEQYKEANDGYHTRS